MPITASIPQPDMAQAQPYPPSMPQPDMKESQLYQPSMPQPSYAQPNAGPSPVPQPSPYGAPVPQHQPSYPSPNQRIEQVPVAAQPAATTPMAVGAGGGGGPREFKHGLFSCGDDMGTCCLACWCPCISYGKNVTRYRHLQNNGTPHPTNGDGCGSECWVHCLLTSCLAAGWVLQIFSRENTRNRYRINGSVLNDCCAAFWCTPCELTQESLELEEEEKQLRKQGPGALA